MVLVVVELLVAISCSSLMFELLSVVLPPVDEGVVLDELSAWCLLLFLPFFLIFFFLSLL